MMDELVEAENKLLNMLNVAVSMLRTILNKMSIASGAGKGDQPLDALAKEYVQAVEVPSPLQCMSSCLPLPYP